MFNEVIFTLGGKGAGPSGNVALEKIRSSNENVGIKKYSNQALNNY